MSRYNLYITSNYTQFTTKPTSIIDDSIYSLVLLKNNDNFSVYFSQNTTWSAYLYYKKKNHEIIFSL